MKKISKKTFLYLKSKFEKNRDFSEVCKNLSEITLIFVTIYFLLIEAPSKVQSYLNIQIEKNTNQCLTYSKFRPLIMLNFAEINSDIIKNYSILKAYYVDPNLFSSGDGIYDILSKVKLEPSERLSDKIFQLRELIDSFLFDPRIDKNQKKHIQNFSNSFEDLVGKYKVTGLAVQIINNRNLICVSDVGIDKDCKFTEEESKELVRTNALLYSTNISKNQIGEFVKTYNNFLFSNKKLCRF